MVLCPDCGKEVKDAKFCSNCGSLLPKAEEVEVNDVVEATEAEAVEPQGANIVEVPEVEAVDVKSAEESDGESADEEPIDVNEVKKSKFCPNCGNELKDDTPFCPFCGFKLVQEEQQPKTKFCQSCGKEININAEICPHCGVRVAGLAPSEEKSVFLAAILSFLFPGLGHLYNGLTKKGVSFIIAYIISAVLIFILIGFVLVIIVWIWALVDSIKTTEAINRGEYVEDKLF